MKLNMKLFTAVMALVLLAQAFTLLAAEADLYSGAPAYRAGHDPIPLTSEAMTPRVNSPMLYGGTDALLLSCMDYRLTEDIYEFMHHDLGMHAKYDYVILAGASLGVNNTKFPSWGKTFWEHLDTAIALHSIHKVLVVDHRNCGAYKVILGKDFPAEATAVQLAEETLAHKEQLDTLAKAIHTKYPDLTVETFLMSLDGKVDHIGSVAGKAKAADKH